MKRGPQRAGLFGFGPDIQVFTKPSGKLRMSVLSCPKFAESFDSTQHARGSDMKGIRRCVSTYLGAAIMAFGALGAGPVAAVAGAPHPQHPIQPQPRIRLRRRRYTWTS